MSAYSRWSGYRLCSAVVRAVPEYDIVGSGQHGIDDEVQFLRRLLPPCRSPLTVRVCFPPTSASRIIPDARRRALSS